jgi:hypothetical protein
MTHNNSLITLNNNVDQHMFRHFNPIESPAWMPVNTIIKEE